MIRAYQLNNQTLTHTILEPTSVVPKNTIWLDIKCPTEEEREWMQHLFTEEVPEEDDIDEIESSSRFYIDRDGIHITSLFPQRKGRETDAANVLFTLHNGMLISFREEDVSIIRLLRHYIKHDRLEVKDELDILLELLDLKVESLSDYIEDSYTTLEETADQILSDDDEEIHNLLQELIFQEGTITQIRLSLFDTRKALRFLRKAVPGRLTPAQFSTIDEILQDIESLLPHTQFLFDKINFQLQTAMSYTNHKQNKIIKIFSVAAVVFMPPTWIASVYGMNFKTMPELEWQWGYPASIGLMIISAGATYLFFKRKKWL
ncbi:MAG: magnesium/cobalt transporter CorA [Succinivibrionaceae bacterium]|nr:magnesium/cobalt transporter CorA [Ruminobacter sp.]MDY5779359.1 magnesium/cobalt transporter CorA [Succinivibrionaceae bacterium]MEE1340507.1 magnesium/cobalt transporter CorA [Succinivibrionaceae bacterium]